MQNVMTDLKAWLAPLQPETRHNGKLCQVRSQQFVKLLLHS